MLESSAPNEDMEKAVIKIGLSKEELKDRFQSTREQWIARDERGWFAANTFYTPTIELVKYLIEHKQSVYVITTKHSSFALKLLENAGISGLEKDRVFGLGSGEKREVLTEIAKKRESMNGGSCIFVEDRIETLRDVAAHCPVPATLVVAGYGYNTSHNRTRAREKDHFCVFDTSQEMCDWMKEKAAV